KTISVVCSHVCSVNYHPKRKHVLTSDWQSVLLVLPGHGLSNVTLNITEYWYRFNSESMACLLGNDDVSTERLVYVSNIFF
ncbi:hypothetical protein S83_059862, partial [Arachis hypogaea]